MRFWHPAHRSRRGQVSGPAEIGKKVPQSGQVVSPPRIELPWVETIQAPKGPAMKNPGTRRKCRTGSATDSRLRIQQYSQNLRARRVPSFRSQVLSRTSPREVFPESLWTATAHGSPELIIFECLEFFSEEPSGVIPV